MSGKGHGTLITGSSAQGNARVYVTDTGAAESYQAGQEYDILNDTGSTISAGQIVEIGGSDASLVASTIGTRGRGSVNDDGDQLTITDPGDTGLSGTISISGTYGENDGWGGARNVRFSNVNGQAAYLGDE